jgi:hypothetical protein
MVEGYLIQACVASCEGGGLNHKSFRKNQWIDGRTAVILAGVAVQPNEAPRLLLHKQAEGKRGKRVDHVYPRSSVYADGNIIPHQVIWALAKYLPNIYHTHSETPLIKHATRTHARHMHLGQVCRSICNGEFKRVENGTHVPLDQTYDI